MSTTPTLRQLFLLFLKMGAFAFGGVYSMLTFFQREIVEKRGWLEPDEFAEGVAIGQITPGPPIVNTGIYIGYHLKGLRGALATTAGQVIPGLILVILLAYGYAQWKTIPLLTAVLKGVGAAVVGLLASMVVKMGRTQTRTVPAAVLAVAGFLLLHFLKVNPVVLILLAGAAGWFVYGRA
jgi:chromate transporter